MDGKLSKNQNDMTFQMKVMPHKNKNFLEQHRINAIAEKRKKAEQRTKELLELSAKLRGLQVKDLDEEMESMLDELELLDTSGVEESNDSHQSHNPKLQLTRWKPVTDSPFTGHANQTLHRKLNRTTRHCLVECLVSGV